MRIRLGAVTATTSTYHECLSGVPIRYEVAGLPSGQRVVIGQVNHDWRILSGAGEPGAQWSGDFKSPTEALKGLASTLGVEADVPPMDAQAHDGVARQDEEGRWDVWVLDEFNVMERHAGPIVSKSDATKELQRLVPVKDGDQFVVDAIGVVEILNNRG